jgi:hypothetical protein
MKKLLLATAVVALSTPAMAFAFDPQTPDDCREFLMPHHGAQPQSTEESKECLREFERRQKIAGEEYQQWQREDAARAQREHDEEIARQQEEFRRMLEEKKAREAETNRRGLELWKERQRVEQEAIRKAQERTNELARQAAEAEETNRNAAEARVQEETQKRRLEAAREKAYLDSLSPAERRARKICRPLYAQYSRVETGMDLDQVQEIFDCNGKEDSKTEAFGSVTTFRSFGDLPRGGVVTIIFVNGKVTSKSQIGLQG